MASKRGQGSSQRDLRASQRALMASQKDLRASQRGLMAGGGGDVRTDVWMDERTDKRTENLPILQDFVPYRGRCPKRELHCGESVQM